MTVLLGILYIAQYIFRVLVASHYWNLFATKHSLPTLTVLEAFFIPMLFRFLIGTRSDRYLQDKVEAMSEDEKRKYIFNQNVIMFFTIGIMFLMGHFVNE